MNEIIKANNTTLMRRLIPQGYKPLQTSKVYDSAFNKPIELDSYKVELLIKNN